MEERTPSDHFVTADRESSDWVPTESGAPSLQSSSDLRFLGTTRPWRGVKDFAFAVMSSTSGVLKPDSAGFEGRSLVKWELRSVPWFVMSLSSLGDSSTFFTNFCMLMAVDLGPEGPSFVRDLQWDVFGA